MIHGSVAAPLLGTQHVLVLGTGLNGQFGIQHEPVVAIFGESGKQLLSPLGDPGGEPPLQLLPCIGQGVQRMLLGGKDVSAEIRTPLSSIYASDVSAIPEVRAFLMDMQRDMAKKYSVIMDGRDIGTVVLPDADVKIFLTADACARAQRRFLELEKKGIPTPYDEVLRDIEYRDAQDSSRAAAPLKAADDAVVLDNTNLSFDESVEAACRIIEEKAGL